MGAPSVLFDEFAAFDQLKAFVVAACPEVPQRDIYRARPSASPGKYGPTSIVMLPLTPVPRYMSPMGAEVDAVQAQRWRVRVTTAAAGAWSATVLGQAAPFVAAGGDTAADIATGLKAAVDALGLAVTTSVPAGVAAAFDVTADVAGVSLGMSISAAAGGAYVLTVEDDNVRRAVYNWGEWTVRIIFRDTPSAQQVPANGAARYDAGVLAERVRLWFQASSLPVTNGTAYPYRRDQLVAAPARLAWKSTGLPIAYDEEVAGTWVRVVGYDVTFQVPIALTHDVPSLDAIGLASAPIIADE